MSEIKENIAQNIVRLRIENKMTQPELASRLNYSDKSISKWENGIATPPIDVLKELADIFNVSLDYLVCNTDDSSYDATYSAKEYRTNKVIITLLAVSLVWMIATFLYVYTSIFADKNLWILFVYAFPLSLIVLLVFNLLWGKKKFTFIIISVLIWGIITSCYLSLLNALNQGLWAIFILGAPMQIVTVLWSQLKTKKSKPKRKTNLNKKEKE